MDARVRLTAALALGGVAAVTAGGALTAGASAAAVTHHCGNASEVFEIKSPNEPVRKVALKIEAITTRGISCSGADKFLSLVYKNTNPTTTPEHFKCTIGHFKAPLGHVPQVCTKPGVRIQYAAPGG